MKNNKRTLINLICSIMVFATNVLISFFLSPYIVKNIGVEANGFVTLANNFITYAQLIVTALNSMAARYITISYVQKDYKKANLYYNSVFWGNLVIVAILILPAVYFIVRLETIINVSSNLVWDVKLLFTFIFFNFFITTGAPNYDCGTYVSNRLDRTYIPKAFISLFKCLFIFILFTIFTPHVWYVGFAASIMTVFLLAIGGWNTHKLTPKLKISLKKGHTIFSLKIMKELVSTGVWSSISNVGNILISGLDLIICNIAIGSVEMGILSLSKTIPSYMQHLSSSIRDAFAPELTINYAKGDKITLLKDIKRAMKLTSVILTIPIAGIVVLGGHFFELWVPSQDAKLLQTLSILSILGYMFTSGTQILYNVFMTVNRVKQNSIAMLLSGLVSTGITILLIIFTDLDIYAVAGVSTFVNLVRNMSFTLPYTAKCLGFRWYEFYPQVLTTIISSIILIIVGTFVDKLLSQNSWGLLFLSAIIVGILGLFINILLILSKEERSFLFNKISDRIKHK